ncbi:MAG TPA: M1 family aminopeptidase [Bacteroidia bacterium]
MYKLATLLFLLCLTFKLSAQPQLESLAKQELTRYTMLNKQSSKRSNQGNIDLIHVRLQLQPNMSNGRIDDGRVTLTFKTTADISRLEIDLRKELKVDSVIYHGNKLMYAHNFTHLLTFNFPSVILSGQIDSVTVFYNGTPNMSTRAYFRDVNASGPSISTLSQPYGAHYWWPCRENLIDKIDSIDFLLNVDTPYFAVANGKLKSVNSNGNKRMFHYSHRYPIVNYLVAVSFSRYNIYKDTVKLLSINKDLDVIHHVFPHNDDAVNRKRTSETGPMIHLFDSLFGEYPFSKEHYGHAQFSWSGGMEHQTMSFMSNFDYDLIAHELGHQWFGDKITCATWKDIWLNESFATYTNLLCYDYLKPDAEWINQLKSFKDDVLSEPDGSVYAKDTSNVDQLFSYRTTYQKGALVLHQLRWLMGDSSFFQGLRNYLNDNDLKYGFAGNLAFKLHMEEVSGLDLDDYFNDWIFGEGFPTYDITWSQSGKKLKLKISQKTSHTSVKTFNVPLPLNFVGNNKNLNVRVPVTDTVFNVEYEVDFKVKSLETDPREWLLARFTQHFTLSEASGLTIYPNPFGDLIYINAEDFEVLSYEIYDLTGRLESNGDFGLGIAKGDFGTINTHSMADGVYFIRIIGKQQTVVKKIVKQSIK